MGLGKTVQVLALLERRRAARGRSKREHLPSLVVAPRSVLFNWVDEARRFAPKLKVAEHHGSQRWQAFESTRQADLVVTTYATMRLDVERLRQQRFDCIVLDEAQAIKNSASQVAKAARLLCAEQRLALTGTPVDRRACPGTPGSKARTRRRAFRRPLEFHRQPAASRPRTFVVLTAVRSDAGLSVLWKSSVFHAG